MAMVFILHRPALRLIFQNNCDVIPGFVSAVGITQYALMRNSDPAAEQVP
jgi:hypothetical protein